MSVGVSHQKIFKITPLLPQSVPDLVLKIQGVKQLCLGRIWKFRIIAGGPDETVDGQGQPIAVLPGLKGNVLLLEIMGPALPGSLDQRTRRNTKRTKTKAYRRGRKGS